MAFKNPFDPTINKDDPEFGRYMAKYIAGEWFAGNNSSDWKFTKKARKVRELRSWMNDTVDPSQFKEKLFLDKDISGAAIDSSVISFMPRYINQVVDGIKNQFHRVSVEGVDRYSVDLKEQGKMNLRKEMIFRKYKDEFAKKTGVDIPVDDSVPETEEELDALSRNDFKTNYEVAIEDGVQKIFMINNFDEISNLAVEDLVLHGDAIVKPEYDNDIVVKINYVDPENYIHSLNTEKTRDMKGVYYCGEKKTITISELQRLIGRSLSQDEINACKNTNRYTNDSSFVDAEFTVDIVDFCFKATNSRVYKKKYNRGSFKAIKKEIGWEPSKEYSDRKITEIYDTWYGGIFIIGSELVFNYGELSYLSRERTGTRRVLTPYCHYKLSVQAVGERLLPIMKKLHILYAKMDMLIASIKSQGVAIDVDRLTDIMLGDGKTLSPDDIIALYNTKGDLLYSSAGLGDEKSGIPISPIVVSYLSDIQNLIILEKNLFEKCDRITGITPESQGFAPTKGAGVKAYQMAADATTVSTMLFFNGWYSLVRSVADNIVNRIQDAAVYGLEPQLISLIGKFNSDILTSQYFKHYAQFAPVIELKPKEQERTDFIEMLNLAVQNQSLSPEDAAVVKLEMDNPQRAVQVFRTLQRKYRREMQAREQQKSQFESQLEQQKLQAKQQEIKMESEMKLQYELALATHKAKLEAQATAFEWNNKIRIRVLENENNVYVAKIKAQADYEKEQGKLDRLYEQNTMTSAIAEQKQNGMPSIDFKKEKQSYIPQEDNNEFNIDNFITDEEDGSTENEQPGQNREILPGEPGGLQQEAGNGQTSEQAPGTDGQEAGAGTAQL